MNNTLVRSLSGTLFLIVITGSLLWNPVIFTLVMLFSIVIMTREFLSISLKDSYLVSKLITIIGSIMIYLLFFFYFHNAMNIKFFWLLVFPFIGVLISLLYYKDKEGECNHENYIKSSFLMLAPLYIALPFSLTNTILFDTTGTYTPNTLLSMFIILWSCDVGAYIFGISFGQKNGHKLFPSISPKKSWKDFLEGSSRPLLPELFYIIQI